MPQIVTKTGFPRRIREIENTWIRMPDGVRLAARIWLPGDADSDPVPAILEYLPYRKRDGTVERDHLTHPYFAGHGYAAVRVDLRGTGDSEGLCRGEYLRQEQDDALAVIAWLTAQPWCSGKVGMIGISWGGFNGLQVAARQPEALAAVITLCSTDDRYTDDIHFMGGAMLTDKLSWGATAFAIAHTPPDPAIVGDRWREMWRHRLQGNGLWLLDWVRHQRRDSFYAHGSICEDYSAVKTPVYAVGGYADGYTNPIFRMMERLSCPRKALVGPWAHKYPHFASPEPRIGFLQEALRWWDQHLKGIDTGIMEEPMIRAWIQDPAPPSPKAIPTQGRWISVKRWPRDGNTSLVYHLAPHGLRDTLEPGAAPIRILSPETAGWTAPTWCVYGVDPDGALDQNGEAGLMRAFESEPLADDIEIFGFPTLHARVSCDVPQANLIAVLSMVAPDGTARFVSIGVLNLTHRASHADPEPLPRNQSVDVSVQLNVTGQRIPAGYRLRLALASAYWPMIWPAQQKPILTLEPGYTTLELPLHDQATDGPPPVPFPPPEAAAPLAAKQLRPGGFRRSREIDCVTGEEEIVWESDTGTVRHIHTGLDVGYRNVNTYRVHPDDPNSARAICTWRRSYAREGWSAEIEATVSMEALRNAWHIVARLEARDGGKILFARGWDEKIPRDLV